MPKRDQMTLRERARAWWQANGRSFDEALPPGEQGYLAGWHARGRADRVTKAERAVVEALRGCIRQLKAAETVDQAPLFKAIEAIVERANGRK